MSVVPIEGRMGVADGGASRITIRTDGAWAYYPRPIEIQEHQGMLQAADDDGSDRLVPLRAIFTTLLTVSLCGVGGGGGIVWARRIAVERQRWIAEHEFTDIVGLCQFLPGPSIVGIAVCIGARLRGGAGALAALAGFLLVPWTIGLVLGVSLLRYAHLAMIRNVLAGMSAAGAGMLIATGIRILKPHLRRPAAPLFSALALFLMIFVKLPLLVVLLAIVPPSIAVAGFERVGMR